MAFVLMLIRHAQATHNLHGYDKSTAYRIDPPLTDRGQAEARLLTDYLSSHHQDCAALYSSDQGRAIQTAQPISAALGLEIVADHRLRDFGACRRDGTPYPIEQIPHRRSGIVVRDMPLASIADDPAGESYLDMMQRSGQFLTMLMDRYQNGEKILVITHSGPMNTLPGVIMGQGVYLHTMIGVATASLSIIYYNPASSHEHWKIRSLGDTGHLRDLMEN